MIFFFLCVLAFASHHTFADGKDGRSSKSPDFFSRSAAPSPVIELPGKDAFRLGPEDVIEVSVWGNKELTSEMPIRPDGLISYPLIGDIMAKGLTPAELKNKIAKALKVFITDANVTVVVKEINSIQISIAGEVNKPGTFSVNRPISLLHLFSLAEGFTEKADMRKSYLLRGGKKLGISIYKLVREDDFSQNVQLKHNDIIFIHDNFKSRINIMGEIEKPQVITFREGMTILDAVLMAEGLTDVARAKGTKVYRKSRRDKKFKTLKVDLDKVIHEGDLSKNILLQPGDMIHVPRSFF
ncbi:MAG: polysaccharide biosynthesis/export family protein [Nitrospinales bacterium]